jgi:hypothetical protein
MVDVASGVDAVVLTVIVDVHVGVHGVGENDAVAPAGNPEAEKETA